MTTPVITANTTITDGLVYRWYPDMRAAEDRQPAVTASRNGVKAEGWLGETLRLEWLHEAQQVHLELATGHDPAIRPTHRRRFGRRTLDPLPTTGGVR